MNPVKPIALIGLPGSGKSSVGAFLARKMECLFHDTDHALEDLLGCSIRCYFEKNGEAAFRDAETQVLDLLTKEKKNGVLATGGGVILRTLNRQYLRERTLVIYLKATPEQLAR
ncbi:MAG: shikimate kinase, partial [Comamonadaceae bacterium]|nr:shikimate kinase [Comamonadaceae bacterium]